ncbi:hypothetical protein C2G38_1088591 [Gigaspora rosea]|uniref:Uncharacterized protein n=1 Tax=Gigaspora rosea TaxID=44941 RepID=A0A397TVU2_9GLOM|nr:hypothetical protein C2G38_1088591 [Gigaspora rosea]
MDIDIFFHSFFFFIMHHKIYSDFSLIFFFILRSEYLEFSGLVVLYIPLFSDFFFLA